MSQIDLPKWFRRFTYFLFGVGSIIVGYVLGYALPFRFLREFPFIFVPLSPDIKQTLFLLSVVTLAGAFGGFLYAIRQKKLELPYYDKAENMVNPGCLADCLTGVAGAHVIFLIVPGSFDQTNPVEVIKVLGIAIVGGYGGRLLIDKVLSDFLQRIEDKVDKVDQQTGQLAQKVEDKTKSIEDKVDETQDLITSDTQRTKTDARAMTLLTAYFDESLSLPTKRLEELKQLIKDASPKQKADIFLQAKLVREDAQAKGKSFMIERTIPVFEALVESDMEEDELHRTYAQLGYAFKAISNWEQAKAELSEAIEVRDKTLEKSLGEKASFWVYEFNRAICEIKLGENRDPILQDLRTAARLQESITIPTNYRGMLDPDTKREILEWVDHNTSPKDLELLGWLNRTFPT